MTKEEQKSITKISKEFASGFKSNVPSINGSSWLIVDPLSGYLSFLGYKNKVLSTEGNNGKVLFIQFHDGTIFIPAGKDLVGIETKLGLKVIKFKNWMWIES